MRDALVMCRFKRGGDAERQPCSFGRRERAERWSAFDVLHNEVIRADIVERADIGVVEGGDGAGFAQEAVGKLVGAELDRDIAMQPRVASFPHFPHTTLADRREDFVGAEFFAGLKFHDYAAFNSPEQGLAPGVISSSPHSRSPPLLSTEGPNSAPAEMK